MSPAKLVVRVIEGDAGATAECPALSLSVSAPTSVVAVANLHQLVNQHCRVLVYRNGTSGASASELAIAQQVVAKGFDFS